MGQPLSAGPDEGVPGAMGCSGFSGSYVCPQELCARAWQARSVSQGPGPACSGPGPSPSPQSMASCAPGSAAALGSSRLLLAHVSVSALVEKQRALEELQEVGL